MMDDPADDDDFERDPAAPKIPREPLADGIYFGLDENIYHADPALGSGDIRKLENQPEDYWFNSSHNPFAPEDAPTQAQRFGRAVHVYVTEGPREFGRRVRVFDGNLKLRHVREERDALLARGYQLVRQDEYNRICLCGTMIRANPKLGDAFQGGQGEVSVFWTVEDEETGVPIRKKARLDFVKQRASVDLKSIRNSRAIEFPEACRRAIAEWRYDVQAEHYREGRIAATKLENVVGDHDPAWLKAVREQADEFAFVIVFFQAEGAPLTWGTMLSPGNPILEIARRRIEKADYNYRTFVRRFGIETPWIPTFDLTELDINDLPGWYGR